MCHRARRDRLTAQHPHRDRQGLVAVPVQIERDRADDDASTVARVDLFAVVHAAVHRAIHTLSDDGAVGEPARRIERALRRQRGGVVHRRDQHLRPRVSRQHLGEERRDLRRVALGLEGRDLERRQMALEAFARALSAIGDAMLLGA